ncbi:hypothetical protein [Alkalimonas amylolytica]|uniref:Uncharacterized protein n=1 Tax=Alkalimonas amylolytica TaxID=152573 RepID=A0A1H3XR36_ALKAM|nr:hypothetical protein [Alkalimonas amylolytica]SEA01925.1 hypothetical protein SAMN04488051_101358 [Alkalimonas amylolytica]
MSRSGSHAGRGFRYQDAVGVWLLIKSWADELPHGEIIPEGIDDYEIRCTEGRSLIQVKSRRDHLGPFPVSDAASFIRALWQRVEDCEDLPKCLILILERPVANGATVDYWVDEHSELRKALRSDPRSSLFSPLTRICIVPSPSESALDIVTQNRSCVHLAAQIYCSDLLKKVGALADANGLVKGGRFQGITVSDLEETISRLEPLLDFAGMEEALREGYCAAIDFLTPFNDPSFYQGVDVRPSHFAAGLVVERPEARLEVISALESRGAALIIGASGTGKSALMWEAAACVRHNIRWFEVKRGHAADAHLFIRLAQMLRASSSAPIGFILDDVGRGLSDCWNQLTRDFSLSGGVLLLGSIREEDVFLLDSRARAAEIRLEGNVTIAERTWSQLYAQGKTSWSGWREPWSRSNGLLLEYTHILTRGERLKSILSEQVERRLREERDDELAILRVAALAGSAGATIEANRLAKVLSISLGNLNRALRRLTDEHLISEPVSGKIKGLHQFRSSVLFELCHTCPPPLISDTVTEAINAVTSDTLKLLIAHIGINYSAEAGNFISHIAERIECDQDPAAAIAAFSGLGHVHVEMTLREWLPKAISAGLEPTQVNLAVMFAVSDLDFSTLPLPERLKAATLKLKSSAHDDPRLSLLSMLSDSSTNAFILKADPLQLRAYLAAMVGLVIPEYVKSALRAISPQFDDIDIEGAADLLSAVQLIDHQTAVAWTKGEVLKRLLARVPEEISWAAPVEVEAAPEGRLLRSSIFHVSDSIQRDIHEETVQLCKHLFGLDPTVTVVAVDAIAADGLPLGLEGGPPIATKRIPRKNSPPTTLPEWNQLWTEAAARLVGAESYSAYLKRAEELLGKLVPVLERIVDFTLRRKATPSKILVKFGEVHDASRLLTPPRDGASGKEPEKFSTPIQNILFNCSSELIRRFLKLPDDYAAYIFWVEDLLKSVELAKSEPWELIGKSPDDQLQRLKWVIESLRLLAAEAGSCSSNPVHLWSEKARKASLGNALRIVKFSVDEQLRTRSISYINQVRTNLEKVGINAELYTRPNWDSPLPWPALAILIIVDISSPVDWPVWLVENGEQIRNIVGESRRIWIAPRINGWMVSRLTVGGVGTLFPFQYAVDDWLDILKVPRLNDSFAHNAERVVNLIVELDNLRCFGLGVEGRPVAEQIVRENTEQQLSEELFRFEELASETSVQSLPRQLNEMVLNGQIALAKSVAAATHGQILPGIEAIIEIQSLMLEEDILRAQSGC